MRHLVTLLALTAILLLVGCLGGCAKDQPVTPKQAQQINVETPLQKWDTSVDRLIEPWGNFLDATFSNGALIELTSAVGTVYILPFTNRIISKTATSGTPASTGEK
jgi:PBP1b-binding outer membrane lipoprotein LpoB